VKLPVNQIVCGDVQTVLPQFPADSIDLIMFSPPYWGLRVYEGEGSVWGGKLDCQHEWGTQQETTFHDEAAGPKQSTNVGSYNVVGKSNFCSKCQAWRGQLGLEPHPQLYIDHMVTVCRLLRHVLKQTGSMYIVVGDTYCGYRGDITPKEEKPTPTENHWHRHQDDVSTQNIGFKLGNVIDNWLQPKQKLLVPDRLFVALQDDGWLLRNKIIWAKPNPMPESCQDRYTQAYEEIGFFTKQQHYYFDINTILKPYKHTTTDRAKRGYSGKRKQTNAGEYRMTHRGNLSFKKKIEKLEGRHPRDVWYISTKSYHGAHFAVYPEQLCVDPIKTSCPQQICKQCGKPRERIVGRNQILSDVKSHKIGDHIGVSDSSIFKNPDKQVTQTFLGWSDCGCGAGFTAGVVLDPMCGSGTTCVVAHKLGRRWIGIDSSSEYCNIATKRLEEVGAFSSRLDTFI